MGSRRTGRGFTAGPAFRGARCAPLQGWGFIPKGGCWGKWAARCLQPAETVAANIVRHGGSLREKRTGPAGTHPPRFCGAQSAAAGRRVRGGSAFCGARCAPLQGAVLWRMGSRFCGAQSAAAGRRVRGGFVAHGAAFCGARCAPLQGAVLRRTGPAFCGARCAPLQGAGLRRTGRRGIFPAAVPVLLYMTKVEFRWRLGGVQMKILNNP